MKKRLLKALAVIIAIPILGVIIVVFGYNDYPINAEELHQTASAQYPLEGNYTLKVKTLDQAEGKPLLLYLVETNGTRPDKAVAMAHSANGKITVEKAKDTGPEGRTIYLIKIDKQLLDSHCAIVLPLPNETDVSLTCYGG